MWNNLFYFYLEKKKKETTPAIYKETLHSAFSLELYSVCTTMSSQESFQDYSFFE